MLSISLITESSVKKDLNGTRERVKHALQHEEEPQPHKRKRRTDNGGELLPLLCAAINYHNTWIYLIFKNVHFQREKLHLQ